MSRVHEKKCGDELRKYIQQVAVGPNEAAAESCHLTRFVTRPCNPSAAELSEGQNARYGELNRSQQNGRK